MEERFRWIIGASELKRKEEERNWNMIRVMNGFKTINITAKLTMTMARMGMMMILITTKQAKEK